MWNTHASQLTNSRIRDWIAHVLSKHQCLRIPPRIPSRQILMTYKVLHNLALLPKQTPPTSPPADVKKRKKCLVWGTLSPFPPMFATKLKMIYFMWQSAIILMYKHKKGWNAANVDLKGGKTEKLHFISFSPFWRFWNIESSFSLVYYMHVSERLFQSSSPSDTDLGHFI